LVDAVGAARKSAVWGATEYDGGVALLKLEDWTKAAVVLDEFRGAFPNHALAPEATKQLAFAYRQGGKAALAASEYERVATDAQDPELGREALLAAADLYEQAADRESALKVYEKYVAAFPQPVEAALEARWKMAETYKAKGDQVSYEKQLHEIVARDASAGAERTNRTKYLAAQSGLVLSGPLYSQFAELKLTQPFDKSLAAKRKRMDAAMQAFEDLTDYEVAEVTAAATYYMAEIYWNFNRSLVESQRPTGLDAPTLAEYEDALEEQAFPFEGKAIEFHEKNRELIAAGVYNDWTKKSLARLVELVPGRYAKREVSSGFLPAIDVYAYRAPSATAEDTGVRAAQAAPAAPAVPENPSAPQEKPSNDAPKDPTQIREAAVEAGDVVL